VLDLLNTAFGFVGAPGAGPNALSAPQAGLISTLAKGVLGGDLNWPMLRWGALAGVGFIILDELLGKAKKLRLPPLAVGIGIYLPMAAILAVAIGAIVGWFYNRWADRTSNRGFAHRLGVLTATGMIVGESLWGVAFAGIVAGSGSDSPLAMVGDEFEPVAVIGGMALFIALTVFLYRKTRKMVGTTP
jgi:putative OPT family oligopeptide transporter